MIIVLLIFSVKGLKDSDCSIIAPQTKSTYILLYVPFGATFQAIQPYWQQVSYDDRTQIQYIQVNIAKDNNYKCIADLLQQKSFPYLIYIEEGQYDATVVLSKSQIMTFMAQSKILKPLPQFSYIFQFYMFLIRSNLLQFIQAGLFLLLAYSVLRFRLSIYKDKPKQ